MKNRFDLEEAMSGMLAINDELELIIHKVGDCETAPTEDELLNMLIGVIELNKVRYEKLWGIFEDLIKNKKILNNAE
jgi:hypothetical protein